MLINTRAKIDDCAREILQTRTTVVKNFVTEGGRKMLLHELKWRIFDEVPLELEECMVKQHFVRVDAFDCESLFTTLKDTMEWWFSSYFANAFPDAFLEPITFTKLVVQRYARGTSGISPQRDAKGFSNLNAMIVLEGSADFFVCEDCEGSNSRKIHNEPGDMIILGTMSLMNRNLEPFYYLNNIKGRRTICSLRQR